MPALLDEIVLTSENGSPLLEESEEAMALADEIVKLGQDLRDSTKDLRGDLKEVGSDLKKVSADLTEFKRTTETSLGKITTDANWIKLVGGVCIFAAFGWLYLINQSVSKLGEKVASIEGRGGSIAVTEAQLINSKTPAEAAANAALLSAQIQKAAASNKPLSDTELARLSITAVQATNSFPQVPAVWNAASRVVNTRFEKNATDNSKPCLGRNLPRFPETVANPAYYYQKLADCTLVIDDLQAYLADPGYQRFVAERPTHPTVWALMLQLTRVRVVYRGGTVIPVNFFVFNNCTFEFALPTAPTNPGQTLVRQLLTADTALPVTIPGNPSPAS